ncbi:hypothetical protein AX14_010802 [Amanita brunnescens Koide BX004]|nr:hypothetical protein AX14_010802 [Amanita brunnescens Koide BX004]
MGMIYKQDESAEVNPLAMDIIWVPLAAKRLAETVLTPLTKGPDSDSPFQ